MDKSPVGLFGLQCEMGYSRQDFLRLLPGGLSGYSYFVDDDLINITLSCGSVLIRLGREYERNLTKLVRFPALPFYVEFLGVDATEQALFMKKFDLSYMKGLG